MQQTGAQGRTSDASRPVGEEKQKDRRGQGETEPCGQPSQIAAPNETNSEAGLARRRAGEKLRKSDQIDIGALAQPATALDKLGAEVTEMGDRPAKGGHSELEEDAKNLPRGIPRRSRFRSRRPLIVRSFQDFLECGITES